MTFAITVDQTAWFAHHAAIFQKYQQQQQLIAVIKSNGYGLTQANLAKVAAHHGLERVAVGTVYEISDVAANFTGEIVVLEPLNPADTQALKQWQQVLSGKDSNRIIATIANDEGIKQALSIFPDLNFVLELRTSMNRFGTYGYSGNWPYLSASKPAGLLGITAHFPLKPNTEEVLSILKFASEFQIRDVAISHVSNTDLQNFSATFPDLNLRMRIGSELWLGNRKAIRATGTVLEAHSPPAFEKVGYHQTNVSTSYIVISGGTAHGIGLAAPSANRTLKQRVNAVGLGALQGIGKSLSPFIVNGKKAWFVEPPHQHVSIVYGDFKHDIVGTQIEADVRFTTTKADVVLGIDL